jgi:hypothetical protein
VKMGRRISVAFRNSRPTVIIKQRLPLLNHRGFQ